MVQVLDMNVATTAQGLHFELLYDFQCNTMQYPILH